MHFRRLLHQFAQNVNTQFLAFSLVSLIDILQFDWWNLLVAFFFLYNLSTMNSTKKNILPLLPWCSCLHFAIFPYLMSLLLFFQFFFISVRSDCCHQSSCLFLRVSSLTSSLHLCRLLPITTPRTYHRPCTCASSLTSFLYYASFHDPPPTIFQIPFILHRL